MLPKHLRHHRAIAATVAALGLLTLSDAHGQATGAAATFEGRPAMAGAQAGTGALAGPPQGGIGVQGQDGVRPLVPRDRTLDRSTNPGGGRDAPREAPPAQRDRDPGVAAPRDRDTGVATPRNTGSKVRRAARSTRDAVRHGVAVPGTTAP